MADFQNINLETDARFQNLKLQHPGVSMDRLIAMYNILNMSENDMVTPDKLDPNNPNHAESIELLSRMRKRLGEAPKTIAVSEGVRITDMDDSQADLLKEMANMVDDPDPMTPVFPEERVRPDKVPATSSGTTIATNRPAGASPNIYNQKLAAKVLLKPPVDQTHGNAGKVSQTEPLKPESAKVPVEKSPEPETPAVESSKPASFEAESSDPAPENASDSDSARSAENLRRSNERLAQDARISEMLSEFMGKGYFELPKTFLEQHGITPPAQITESNFVGLTRRPSDNHKALSFIARKRRGYRVPVIIHGTKLSFWVELLGGNLFTFDDIIRELATVGHISNKVISLWNDTIISKIGETNVTTDSTHVSADSWKKIIPCGAFPMLEMGFLRQGLKKTSKVRQEFVCPYCNAPLSVPIIPEQMMVIPDNITHQQIQDCLSNTGKSVPLETLISRYNNRHKAFESYKNLTSGDFGFNPEIAICPESGHWICLDTPMMADMENPKLSGVKSLDGIGKSVEQLKKILALKTSFQGIVMLVPAPIPENPARYEMIPASTPQECREIIDTLSPTDLDFVLEKAEAHFNSNLFKCVLKTNTCKACNLRLADINISDRILEFLFF